MSLDKIKEVLGAVENGEELLQTLSDEFGKVSKGEENQRKAKSEILKVLGVENKDEALKKIAETFNERDTARTSETALNDLLGALNANNKDDILEKVRAFEDQLTKTNEQLGTITTERETEKVERLKAEKEKKEALRISEFTKVLSDNKIEDKKGLLLSAMLNQSKENEDGQWLIGDVKPVDFIQDVIDSKEPMFTTITKKETPPNPDADKLAEIATARSAMGLSPEK